MQQVVTTAFTQVRRNWVATIPKVVRNIRDGVISLFAGLIPFQGAVAEWLNTTEKNFTTACGVGIVVVGVIAKMFGVTDQVTTVKQQTTETGVNGE